MEKEAKQIVVDGNSMIMGRLASQVAKMLLNGNRVVVLNAEKMVVSGHVRSNVDNWKQRLDLKDKANPEHSPYWSRRPDYFVKRVIRGMLPFQRPRGKEAFRQLRVYAGIPAEFKGAKLLDTKTKRPDEMFEDSMTVKQLVEKLGYRS